MVAQGAIEQRTDWGSAYRLGFGFSEFKVNAQNFKQMLAVWFSFCSDRVAGAGCFGAALMLQPQLVADCCKAVAEAVASVKTRKDGNPPAVTVKCRLGK